MTDPANSGTTEQSGATERSGTEDDSVTRRAQAASGAGENHDVGTDGDEQSAADRADQQQ